MCRSFAFTGKDHGMDLSSRMSIKVTTVAVAQPAQATTPGGHIEPYEPGNRVLYAFQYERGGGPIGSGCICNQCAADPDKYERIRTSCGYSNSGELALVTSESYGGSWACCQCGGYYDQYHGRRY
jgi:hypothetical protein